MMRIDAATGRVSGAEFIASPNYDARPNGTDISLLVIHNISLPPGQFGGSEIVDFFCNALDCSAHPFFGTIHAVKVSSHLLIRRDGQVIQFVPLHLRAWHAGESEFQGVKQCNHYSIGIELEGTDDLPYNGIQYDVLVELAQEIMRHYPAITMGRIVGHEDIAPGRKTDPGPSFDWPHFRRLLSAE